MGVERKRKFTALFAAVLMVTSVLLCCYIPDNSSAEPSGDYVLVDWGNGTTEWIDIGGGADGTVESVIAEALLGSEIEVEISGSQITVNGLTTKTVGSSGNGGSFTESGMTGKTVSSKWNVFSWDDGWKPATLSDSVSSSVALAFGTDSYVPVETPEFMTSWTMTRGDSAQTGHMDVISSYDGEAEQIWSDIGAAYASVTYAEDRLFVKYGTVSRGMGTDIDMKENVCFCVCYDIPTGNKVWTFEFPGMNNYETSSALIVGNDIFVSSAFGYVFKFDWRTGPGTMDSDGNYPNVIMTSLDGEPRPYSASDVDSKQGNVPDRIEGAELSGYEFNTGFTSFVSDSGVIYGSHANGMVYCMDTDLNLIWSYQTGGCIYYTTPTIYDDFLFVGSLNGDLYVLNKITGELIDSEHVYSKEYNGKEFGSVSVVSVLKQNSDYRLIFPVSEGRGMSTKASGFAVYDFNGVSLQKKVLTMDEIGLTGNTFTPFSGDGFTGVFATTSQGIYKIDTEGRYEVFNQDITSVKAPINIVNGEYVYVTSYAPLQPVYQMDTDGKILTAITGPAKLTNYAMSSVVLYGNYIIMPNDSGIVVFEGEAPVYVYAVPESESPWTSVLLVVAGIALIIAAIYCYLRFVRGVEKPFSYLAGSVSDYLNSDQITHNTRSKHRLITVIAVGILLTVLMFIASLCIGPTRILSPGEMFGALFSSLQKGGVNLTYDELMVYSSRLPRTIVAFAVGIGLSVAGVVYQAIIRNPLVDPYIMGVSSGAGTAAIAVIGFNFTFFGLFPAHSIYLTAMAAMVGGVIAFAITMLLAEKSGGSSVNYVLAGVVVGLVFSAAQSVMMTMGTEHVADSLSWLYGSFANVSWSHVAIVFFPVLGMSLATLIWAKEFNLVLLGEDQAKQMGLDVVKFNRWMLILASVLTSLCVAFVGIIGFVGLVVPHLCRMILGGDHRLVIPASISFGGFLMIAADLAARMIWAGSELPVGAITTLIGVPVFAWLLIKRGRMYDG